MDIALQPYLEELKQYAGAVRVPGLGVASEPIPLKDIFIEKQLEPQPRVSPATSPERRAGFLNIFGKSKYNAEHEETNARPVVKGPPEPAHDVLAREPQLVILGEPGQGKSTLLRAYAIDLAAKPRGFVPLLVELGQKRAWNEGAGVDFEWLHERLPEPLKVPLDGKGWRACRRALQSGEAIVLLDGLDESSDHALREIMTLVTRLKGNRIVLSSRPHAYRQTPLAGFKVFTLGDLQTNQIELLAVRLCRALASQFGVDGTAAFEKVRQVAYGQAAIMARNPLLLSFMCLSAVSREADKKIEEFPTRPAPLLGECVEALVEWHRKFKPDSGWPNELTGSSVVKILGKLALHSFEDRSGVIHPEPIEELAATDKQHFLGHLAPARFVEQQHRDYSFPLETFREYFAARAVAASPDPYAVVKRHLHIPEWQRVILYVAGSLPRQQAPLLSLWLPTFSWLWSKGYSSVISIVASLTPHLYGKIIEEVGTHIRGRPEGWLSRSRQSTEFFITAIWRYHCGWGRLLYESILHRDLNLAGRCVWAAGASCPARLIGRIARPLARDAGETALSEAGQHQPLRQRWLELARGRRGYKEAVALKVVIAEPEVTRFFLEWSFDKSAGRRYVAVQAMAKVATEPRVRERLLVLARDAEEQGIVREDAVRALESVKDEPEVRERLLELVGDKDEHVRSLARRLAGVIDGDPDDKSDSAATATEVQAEIEPQPKLGEQIVARNPDRESYAPPSRMPEAEPTDPKTQKRLLELTRDHDCEVRYLAVRALAPVAHATEVRKRIVELINDEEDSLVKGAAVNALSSVASCPEVLESLLKLANSYASPMVRDAATKVLSEAAAQPEGRMRLLELTRCKQVSRSAARARVAKEPKKWRKLMFEGIRKEHLKVQRAAVEALASEVADPQVQVRLAALTWRLITGFHVTSILFVIMTVPFALRLVPELVPLALKAYLIDMLKPVDILMHAYMPVVVAWVASIFKWTLSAFDGALKLWPLVIVYLIGKLARWWDLGDREGVGESALRALRGWKGPVPRLLLWRVAFLVADSASSERCETLAALLRLREGQSS